MHVNHKRLKAHGNAAPRGHRAAASRSSRPPLALVRSQVEGGHLTGPVGAAVDVGHQVAAGQLVTRWQRRDDASILWLTGTLDGATASLLDRELDARAIRMRRLVVDLTGLEVIDTSGLDSLERIHRRACERGDRLSLRHGPHVVERPFDLPRAVQPRSRWAPRPVGVGVGDENFYFALAMAGVDVDHPRPDDRPGAA